MNLQNASNFTRSPSVSVSASVPHLLENPSSSPTSAFIAQQSHLNLHPPPHISSSSYSLSLTSNPVSTFGIRIIFDPSHRPLSRSDPSCNSLQLEEEEIPISNYTIQYNAIQFKRPPSYTSRETRSPFRFFLSSHTTTRNTFTPPQRDIPMR